MSILHTDCVGPESEIFYFGQIKSKTKRTDALIKIMHQRHFFVIWRTDNTSIAIVLFDCNFTVGVVLSISYLIKNFIMSFHLGPAYSLERN
jgi:hypothetical protein